LKRLWLLGRPHLRLLIISFVCMAMVGLTTGAYAWLLGPALRFLLTGGTAGLEPLFAFWPQAATWSRERLLWWLPSVLIAIGVVKGVGYLGQFYFVGLYGQRVVVDLRRAVFARFLALSPRQSSQQLSGDLLSRFTSDIAAVETAATYTIASWLRDPLQIAILVAVAFSRSWQLSVLSVLIVPLAVWPASRLTRALMRRVREAQSQQGTLSAQVQEGIGAMKTLQVFGAQRLELQRFEARANGLERSLSRAAWARAGVPGVMELLAAVAIASALSFALTTSVVTPEALVSFLAAIILLYQPAKDLGRVSQFAVAAATALERLDAVLSLPQPVQQGSALATVRQSVRLEDLRFGWGERAALEGVNLEIPVGQITALVGESGSGKSTLAALLLRFEVPQSGRVLLDGLDAANASLESVRAQFALVTQEPLLFAATIRENLSVGAPSANQAQLEAAARTADAHEFICALPHGYETLVGERGVTLSGGQKQRLCLARALLSGAPVLILDEATSSLDSQSEAQVQQALDRALVGRTALVIAHRLSTIAGAHRIAVLEQGRVIESGTHVELLAREGRYAALWAKQLLQD
jgi:subfamily B ATP-binding cassette protein MsbA